MRDRDPLIDTLGGFLADAGKLLLGFGFFGLAILAVYLKANGVI
jgi:hypothetical protein